MPENQTQHASALFLRIDEEKRDRIIGIAVEAFATHGFAATNVNHIAERAGISVGALYKYFATKEDLFLYIVEVSAQRIRDYVQEVLAADIRLSSKLERLLRLAQDYSKSDPTLIKLYNVFSADSDTARAELIAGKIEGITAGAYRQLIADAQQKGEVRADIDPGILAFLVDNQLMSMQFSFACGYYAKRFSLFVGPENVQDNEYVIRSIVAALESMLGLK